MVRAGLPWILLLAISSLGCGRYYEMGPENRPYGRGEFASMRFGGYGLTGYGPTVVAWERPPSDPEVVDQTGYVSPGTAAPRSKRDRPPQEDDLPRFDPQTARAALNEVTVTGCNEADATGFGHAFVTMNPDGRISKVVVDQPSNLPASAVQCIGERLGEVRLRPFRGSAVQIGTTFRLN